MPDPTDNAAANPPEVTLDTVSVKELDQLDDNDKKWLEENKDTLDDATADKFGIIKPPKDVTPEVRGGQAAEDASGKETKPNKEEDEDEDDIDPEDQKRISKLVNRELAKHKIPQVTQQVQEAQLITEVDEFIRVQADKIPNIGNYRQAILTYAKHPSYSQVPVSAIFNIVAGKDLMKIGAQRERQAAAKAKETRTDSSSSGRADGNKKDWSTASKEDFAAQKASVLGRPS